MAKKSSNKRKQTDTCSFCGKRAQEVVRLIAGPPGVFICNECIDLCSSLLDDHTGHRPTSMAQRGAPPTPQEITAYLDQFIIGQNRTKRVLAVAVYNHYKRLQHAEKRSDSAVELEKSNILLIGPTGCGKTLFARCLSHLLNVPFAIGDATTITEAGYVGEDVENLLLRLLQSADFDIPVAETGILYIDEIDKVSKSSGNVSITRDVSGEGVQQSLLKLIEGTVSNVPPTGGRKHPEQQYLQIDTNNILFICGGAFSGLDEIIARRLGAQVVGFDIQEDDDEIDHLDPEAKAHIYNQVTDEDLVGFGLIPELVGRLPVVTAISELSEDDLVQILLEPQNSLVKQYQALFAMDGAQLDFTDDALRCIAQQAMQRRTGARALRSIMEQAMLDIMYELPARVEQQAEYTVTREVIEGEQSIFRDDASGRQKESA